MDDQQALQYIYAQPRFGGSPDLIRMPPLLAALGDPQQKLRFIHVAGTNGKGSVCAYIASILQAAGYRTGLFISPFVLDFRERIQIGGRMIGRRELTALVEQIRPVLESIPPERRPSQFGLVTALGYLYFAQRQCDVVVLETGLGGKSDSTNTIDPPLCSVITRIGLDHMAQLGHTVEQIAAEKAGILKSGSRSVLYPDQPEGAMRVLTAAADQLKIPLTLPDLDRLQIKMQTLRETLFCYRDTEYRIRLYGDCQPLNAITAIEAVAACGLPVSGAAVRAGLQTAFLPGRCQVVSAHPLILADGGHNPDSAKTLAALIRRELCRPVAVIGMMRDKDADGYLRQLAPLFEKIYVVQGDMPRAMDAQTLKTIAGRYNERVVAAQTVGQALKAALDTGRQICICGSFLTVCDALRWLRTQKIIAACD